MRLTRDLAPDGTTTVPQFLPFRGLRYAPGTPLDAVCAPPYDVIEPDERAALAAHDPHNSVRLILPDSYEHAAELLAAWCDDGVLVADDGPSFFAYRMTSTDSSGARRATSGVIGALTLEPPGTTILPHERTLPKAKTDRLELLRATRANFDPIWGLTLGSGLTDLLADRGRRWNLDVVVSAYDSDGVLHELSPIRDAATIAAITAAVAADPMVLADGHHRFETATTYAAERADAGAEDPGAAAIMTFVVELVDDQLWVQPIHRMIGGIGDLDVRAALTPNFEIRELGPNTPDAVPGLKAAMQGVGGLGLVDREGLALLVPRPELDRALAELPEVVREVDASRFDVGVVPALGVAQLTFRHDAAAVAAHVAKGTCDAAVLLRPVTVDQIRDSAAARIRMPEKTTFFAPKPRTGFVFRRLDLD